MCRQNETNAQLQLFITTLLVVSAFAAEKSDAKQNEQGDKKNVKRGVFGLGYGGGYGGYGGLGGYGGSYGGSYHGGSLGGHYGGGYSHGYAAPAAHYSSLHVAPHTHSHSVETKIVPQPYPVVHEKHVPVHVPQPYPVVKHVPQVPSIKIFLNFRIYFCIFLRHICSVIHSFVMLEMFFLSYNHGQCHFISIFTNSFYVLNSRTQSSKLRSSRNTSKFHTQSRLDDVQLNWQLSDFFLFNSVSHSPFFHSPP